MFGTFLWVNVTFSCYLVLMQFNAGAKDWLDTAGGLVLPLYNLFDFHPEI